MSKSDLLWVCPLILFLAGCATAPRRGAAHAPDWESETPEIPMPAPAASLAPVPQPGPAAEIHAHIRPGAATNPKPQTTSAWVSLRDWSEANGLAAPSRLTASAAPAFMLRTSNGALTLRTGSQVACWQGLEVYLGFAPRLVAGQLCVHPLDLEKTIQPLIQGSGRLGLNPRPVIVLDPGHGGADGGARSILTNRLEKEYTLDWARRLQPLLSAGGWQVFLTRSNDTDRAVSNRVSFAQEHKADLFISLHFNSAGADRSESGLETYCLTPAGMPSSLTRGFADDPALVCPNNDFDAQNLQLALCVHRALLASNNRLDRGIRHARFPGVLRGQQRPAVLIEGGYLSNPREARLIADPAYRQGLAEAVAKGLLGETPALSQNIRSP